MVTFQFLAKRFSFLAWCTFGFVCHQLHKSLCFDRRYHQLVELSFATNCGCYTSVNTWQCCPSAVTQSTVSPLGLMNLLPVWRSVVERFHLSLPLLILSFHFSGSFCRLSITRCLLSYSHFTDIGADLETLPCLSPSHLIFWLSSYQFLSVPSCRCLSFLHQSVTLERSKQGNGVYFLSSSFPMLFWHYLWLKLL